MYRGQSILSPSSVGVQPTSDLGSPAYTEYTDDNDVDMCDNQEASTIDVRSLQISQSSVDEYGNDYRNSFTPSSTSYGHTYSNSPVPFAESPMNNVAEMKGGKKIKKEKADSRTCGEEELDLDTILKMEVSRIPVKSLRKAIPKLRIGCYKTDGKKNFKHLWDEQPTDWPANIPFKDPNNAVKDVKKPGKLELRPMFEFLREKWFTMQEAKTKTPQQPSDAASDVMSGISEPSFLLSGSTKVVTNQQFISALNQTSDGIICGMAEEHFNQPLSSHEQNGSVFNEAYVNTIDPPEYKPLIHQSAPLLEHPGNWERQYGQVTSNSHPRERVATQLPGPLQELHMRLETKRQAVIGLANNDPEVVGLLDHVHQEVIGSLYELTAVDGGQTSTRLMFLDAGHQMEALLDVMTVLDQVDTALLKSGCQEIINKFKTTNVYTMMIKNVQPRLTFTDTAVGKHTPGFGEKQKILDSALSFTGFDLEKFLAFDSQKIVDPEIQRLYKQPFFDECTGTPKILPTSTHESFVSEYPGYPAMFRDTNVQPERSMKMDSDGKDKNSDFFDQFRVRSVGDRNAGQGQGEFDWSSVVKTKKNASQALAFSQVIDQRMPVETERNPSDSFGKWNGEAEFAKSEIDDVVLQEFLLEQYSTTASESGRVSTSKVTSAPVNPTFVVTDFLPRQTSLFLQSGQSFMTTPTSENPSSPPVNTYYNPASNQVDLSATSQVDLSQTCPVSFVQSHVSYPSDYLTEMASNLEQAGSNYLDQSASYYLNQSGSSYFDQNTSNYLDAATMSNSMSSEQNYLDCSVGEDQNDVAMLGEGFMPEQNFIAAPVGDHYGMTALATNDPFLPGPTYSYDPLDDIADIISQEVPSSSTFPRQSSIFQPTTMNEVSMYHSRQESHRGGGGQSSLVTSAYRSNDSGAGNIPTSVLAMGYSDSEEGGTVQHRRHSRGGGAGRKGNRDGVKK